MPHFIFALMCLPNATGSRLPKRIAKKVNLGYKSPLFVGFDSRVLPSHIRIYAAHARIHPPTGTDIKKILK